MTNNYENCSNCALQRTCEKAAHIENYHISSGCSDFISGEECVTKAIRAAKELLARSLEMLYLLGYDSGFTNPKIDTLTTDIKKFLVRGDDLSDLIMEL